MKRILESQMELKEIVKGLMIVLLSRYELVTFAMHGI